MTIVSMKENTEKGSSYLCCKGIVREINHGLDHYFEADEDVFNEHHDHHFEQLRERVETREMSRSQGCDLDIKQAQTPVLAA